MRLGLTDFNFCHSTDQPRLHECYVPRWVAHPHTPSPTTPSSCNYRTTTRDAGTKSPLSTTFARTSPAKPHLTGHLKRDPTHIRSQLHAHPRPSYRARPNATFATASAIHTRPTKAASRNYRTTARKAGARSPLSTTST